MGPAVLPIDLNGERWCQNNGRASKTTQQFETEYCLARSRCRNDVNFVIIKMMIKFIKHALLVVTPFAGKFHSFNHYCLDATEA